MWDFGLTIYHFFKSWSRGRLTLNSGNQTEGREATKAVKHVNKCVVSSLFHSCLPGFDFWCLCSCNFAVKAFKHFHTILDVNELRWMEVNSTAAAAATYLMFSLNYGTSLQFKRLITFGKALNTPTRLHPVSAWSCTETLHSSLGKFMGGRSGSCCSVNETVPLLETLQLDEVPSRRANMLTYPGNSNDNNTNNNNKTQRCVVFLF